MRAYSQLADLEALLFSIPDESIRNYVGEAVASYSAGAYRSAIVSIWIAVVYDLYQKFRYLDEQFNDAAAKQCLAEIEAIRNHSDKKQVSAWERTILDKAHNHLKMLTSTEYDHLNRIQQDRHRCAHPVLDDEGFLFQPSPELTRAHIRTAIETLLKQPAIIGKAATDALSRDVEGRYFPNDYEGVSNALLNRHIIPTSEKYKTNLIKFSLKKILFLEPDEQTIIFKYVWVLKCLINQFRGGFEAIDRSAIKGIVEKTKEDRIQFLSLLYNIDERFLSDTPDHVREKFKQFLNENANDSHKAYIIHLFPEIRKELMKKYPELMSDSAKRRFFNSLIKANMSEKDPDFVQILVKKNIDIFSQSGSYSSGRENAENYIKPIIPLLNNQDIEYLIGKIVENKYNDQLIDCSPFMEEVFIETIEKFPKALPSWKNFIEEKKKRWGNMENIEKLVIEAEAKYKSITS